MASAEPSNLAFDATLLVSAVGTGLAEERVEISLGRDLGRLEELAVDCLE
ncbi:MAG TPA: hypothetical protein VE575_02470 [Acidimicrobiales bacterium]|jgi:hypothetical protein|nr:hypothetical protein [Acidimicrobiales bacterium]